MGVYILTLNEQENVETHCIKVTKFTDWTYQLTKTEWMEDIIKDVDFNPIIDDIIIPCGKAPKNVWKANHQFTLGLPAKVTILFESGCGGEMRIGINGKTLLSLNEGECESFQVEHLKTIEVSCDGKDGECTGIFELEFNPYLFMSWLYNAEKECVISNRDGTPHHSHEFPPITCSEVPQEYGRDSINLTLPDWNSVRLQRVKMMKKGFIVLKFVSNNQCIYTTRPIPFKTVDKVLLIAPKNTKVQCEILEGNCEVVETTMADNSLSFEIKLSITMYQKIMAVEKVIIEVEGNYCSPRKDF